MTIDEKILRQRFRAMMPELEIEQFVRNQEGLTNEVVIVNNQFVFRFAKTKDYTKILRAEIKILDLVRPRINVAVPTPIYHDRDCMIYPFLTGEPLKREIVLGLDDSMQLSMAAQLGEFLYGLHNTPITGIDWIPSTLAPVTREKWMDIHQRVETKIYPLLLEHQIEWAENLFETALGHDPFFDYEPALIHGDLASYHILFDPQERAITGVIDFGVSGIGDPALDLGNLINTYGESFVAQMKTSYPALEAHLPRARFYAQSIELQWVLQGLETGETFWFTAHLGGARDIRN